MILKTLRVMFMWLCIRLPFKIEGSIADSNLGGGQRGNDIFNSIWRDRWELDDYHLIVDAFDGKGV